MTSPAPGGRSLLVYAGVIAVGLVTLLLVLPAGSRARPVPQLSRFLSVGGAAAECLGPRLAVEQSGVFIEFHAPVGADPGRSVDQLGPLVAAGRADRRTEVLKVTGDCAPGTALAGQGFGSTLQLGGKRGPDATGRLQVVARPAEELVLAPSDTGSARAPGGTGRLPVVAVVGRLLLAVTVLIAATRLMGSVFTRLRQPRVLGEIVAGVLLGPSLLGSVLPGVTRYLFTGQVTDVLNVMAQLGLILFTFLVGLEVDLKEIRRLGRVAVLISHVSIVVPFSLGVLTALVLYPRLGGGSFAGFALFMGAAMAITAFPVLVRILTDTDLARTPLGALAIACAAIDDVTAWCVLAVVVAVVRSSGAAHVLQVVGLSAVFAAAMIVVVRPALRRQLQGHVGAAGRPSIPVVLVLVGMALLSAWTTGSIGTHAIFGAFTLGLVVPRSPGLVNAISARIEPVTAVVLLPLLFATVGLSTRVGILAHAVQWWLLGLIILAAVAGKWGGSTLAARWAGLPWRDANALGILMNTRGLTEIVILSVGRGLGVVSPSLFTMMVLMAMVTTFMTTPLLAAVYPSRLRR